MEFEVLRPQQLPPRMFAHWRELQRLERGWDSPFLSPLWSRAVEEARGKVDGGLRVVALNQGGRPRGYLAVSVGLVTAMAAGSAMCDYEGVVSEPGVVFDPRELAPALGVHRLDFGHMLAEQAAFAPYAQGGEASWVVDVSDGYGAYAAARRAAGVTVLKDLDKKRRKAERETGPAMFVARSASHADFERLLELKRARLGNTGQTDVFAAGWPLRLVRNLFQARQDGLRGALFTLHLGGALAAAQFHLLGERTVHAWIVGHEAAFERYSPGLLLFQDILRWMDETPYDRLDLGFGDYRFKRELSNLQQEVLHGFVGVPSPAALVRGAAYGVRRAAEALPLGRVSHLPGKAMRRLDLLRGLR